MSALVRPIPIRHGDRLVARSILFLLLGLYTLTFTGLPENPDAETEFQTVSSLVRTGSMALGGTPEAEALIAVRHSVGVGGPRHPDAYYSWYGVGQAYVALPFFLMGQALHRLFPTLAERAGEGTFFGVHRSEYFEHLLVGWRNPLLGALTAWLLVLSTRRLGASRLGAWLAGLGYGVCTFAWPQARSTLSDVQATFFLFLAFHQLVKLRENLARLQPAGAVELLTFGAALGGAFLTRIVTAPAIAVLLVAFGVQLWSLRARLGREARLVRTLALGALPAIACVGVWLWTNWIRFQDVLEPGYHDAVGEHHFDYPPLAGLAGLFFAPGKGLVFLAPACVLALPWLWHRLRGGERWCALTVIGLTLGVFAPIVRTEGWHGAWTYGPRYVLPALPFLWLSVAPSFDAWRARARRRFVVPALLAFGFLTSLPGALVDSTTHLDLATRAARLEWPDLPGADEASRDGARFLLIQTDWRFAAPWAHWRILRHRVAEKNEEFPVRRIFLLDRDDVLEPSEARFRGFAHLAWVDFGERIGGPAAVGWLLSLAFLAVGAVLAARGLDRTLR